jgi:hypothetical protein
MQMYDELQQQPNRKALLDQLGGGLPTAGRVPGIAPGEPAPGTRMPEAPPIDPMQAPQAPKQNASIGSVMPMLREKYKHTPDDLKRAFAENPDAFHGASLMGSKGDKIQFADGKIFDVINSAGLGGLGWQELWDNDPNAQQAPQGGGMAMPGMNGLHPLLGGDALAGIQAAIGQHSGPSSNLQALLQQLQGGR